MSSRRKGREQILQVLYIMDQSNITVMEALQNFQLNFEFFEREMPFIRSRLEGISTNLVEIDKKIAKYSENWKMTRMPKVDRNILRLGTYELEYCEDMPASVVINESIELSKKFGDANSSKFVNGLLDKISKGESQ